LDTILFFILIILFASILQTATGFGFSIMATPFLLFLFDPLDAIQINLILTLVISSALFIKIRKDVDYGVLKRFIIGSTIGLPIGIIILLSLDMDKLKLVIGLIILVLTVVLILKFRIHQTEKRDFFVGGISGSLTASIGMAGPPLLLYFSSTNTGKSKIRGTTLAFYLFIYLMSLMIQIIVIGTNKTIWISTAYALPVVLLGLILGQLLFNRINQHLFRIISYIILLFTGLYLLVLSPLLGL